MKKSATEKIVDDLLSNGIDSQWMPIQRAIFRSGNNVIYTDHLPVAQRIRAQVYET